MAITIGATWLLYISGIFILWAPLPLLYRYGRCGRIAFQVSAFVSLVGLIVIYGILLSVAGIEESHWEGFLIFPGFGLREYFGGAVVISVGSLYFFYYLTIAGVLGWVNERKLSVELSFGLAVIIPVLIGFIVTLLLSLWFGINIVSEIRGYLLHILDKIIDIGGPAGLSKQDFRYIAANREDIAKQIVSVIPAALMVGTLICVWCNIIVARIWYPRLAHGSKSPLFSHFGSLANWRLTDRFVWLAIGAGCLYFINHYIGHGLWEGGVGIIGTIVANVLWIAGAVYFLQGLAIVSFIVQKRSSLLFKVVVYSSLLLFFQVLALFVTVLGILDIWFDFRKLSKGTETPKENS
jgi:uncharacterized protein YybS (DUF2232 family)